MPMCIAGLKLLVSRITFIYLLNQFHKQNFKELLELYKGELVNTRQCILQTNVLLQT